MVEVNGDGLVWKAEGQEYYPPGGVFRWCERWIRRDTPLMSAATELWAGQFLLEPPPALGLPMKNLGLLDGITQMGYVFRREGIIWRVRVGKR